MTPSSFSLELCEGDVQVPVAKLWQSSTLHRGHQATRESPPPGVGMDGAQGLFAGGTTQGRFPITHTQNASKKVTC